MNELTIVIVNFHSETWLRPCLTSIFTTTKARIEVIIVSNSPASDATASIQNDYPQVRWLFTEGNIGFARANNIGIGEAKSDFILLLNPDTILTLGSIDGCLHQLKYSTAVGATVQLYYEDDSPQISGNYFMKGGLNVLLPVPFIGQLLRWVAMKNGTSPTNVAKASGIVQVDWINGAFMMIKSSIIAKAGKLDEDFFLYAEEIEWCSRLRKFGSFEIYGDLKAYHLEAKSSNASFSSSGTGYQNVYDKKGLQLLVSNLLRIRKQFGLGWFLLQLTIYTIAVFTFPIGWVFQRIFSIPQLTIQQGFAYLKNMIALYYYVPRLIMNKPFFYKVL